MIDPKKTYRTRDGREVRIYAVDGLNGKRVHGAIYTPGDGWEHRAWFPDGRMNFAYSETDLIEVKPRIQREVWVNVYPDGILGYHDNRIVADRSGKACGRIACVKLVIDCEEGHGLD